MKVKYRYQSSMPQDSAVKTKTFLAEVGKWAEEQADKQRTKITEAMTLNPDFCYFLLGEFLEKYEPRFRVHEKELNDFPWLNEFDHATLHKIVLKFLDTWHNDFNGLSSTSTTQTTQTSETQIPQEAVNTRETASYLSGWSLFSNF